MRAASIDSGTLTLFPDAPEPAPGPGEALVRVARVLITETDLAVFRGQISHSGVPGQAFVGMVERVNGPDPRGLTGRPVVASPDLPDASSNLARRGLGLHDPDRAVLGLGGRDGALAELIAVPSAALVAVPEEVDADRAVFALALARALHAAQIVRIPGKAFVTVLGDNLGALLAAQVLARLNASVRLLGTMPDRLDRCARWGVKHRHRDDAGRWADQDIVIDSERSAESFALACSMARARGTILLLGESSPHGCDGCDLSPVIERELTVVGARTGSLGGGVELLRSGTVDLDGLITRRFRLDDVAGAMRAAADPASIGVIVDVGRG